MKNIPDDGIRNNDFKEVIYRPINKEGNIQQLTSDATKTSDTMFLYFSVITANFLMFVNGSSIVWTSPVIPQLKSNNSDINPLQEPITTIQISLLAGLPSLFAICGPLVFGKLADVIGRKNTLSCISLVALISNISVAFGNNIYIFYVGRSLMNVCTGLLFVVLPIYLNEICEDHNRAKHGCLMMFFLPLGSLYGYLLGPVTNVKLFTLLCTAPLIPQLILFCLFVPESPIYSASRGDKETSIDALKKLRSNKSFKDIEEDYKQIEIILRSRAKVDTGGLKKIFETRALRKGFIVGLATNLGTFMSGVPVIMAFLGPIFNDADTNLSGNTVAILVGTVKLFFFFVTMTIVGRLGRRPLLLLSSIGAGISLAILAVYFYLNATHSPIVNSIKWLPIVCILVYISSYALGLGSIPSALLSEMFPNDLRSLASSVILTIVNTLGFIITTAFPVISDSLGVHYCIGIFSVGCFLIFVFMYFLLPETKGKSFSEIQEILSK